MAEQLVWLSGAGYRCAVLHFCAEDGQRFVRDRRFRWRGIEIFQSARDDDAAIEAVVRGWDPSIVYTCSYPAPRVLGLARRLGKKTVLTAHSVREIHEVYPGRFASYGERRRMRGASPSRMLREADRVVVPSGYVKRAWARAAGRSRPASAAARRIVVVYPVPSRAAESASRTRRCVTFVGPDTAKGIFRVLALAVSLPEYRFCVVGGARTQVRRNRQALSCLKRLPNVQVTGYLARLDAVYRRTKVLLAPSLTEESFGRAAWEALASGIPVVASRTGYLPELVGSGGALLDPDDGPGWRAALVRLMEDERVYRTASVRARSSARRYRHADQMRRLRSVFDGLVGTRPKEPRAR